MHRVEIVFLARDRIAYRPGFTSSAAFRVGQGPRPRGSNGSDQELVHASCLTLEAAD